MTVSIDIDLNARSAHVKLGALKAQLEELDEDLDIDLDLDGDLGDTLDDLSDTMDELSESFNSDLNETIDRLEGLEFDDISINGGDGDSGGDTGSDSGDRHVPSARQYFSGGPLGERNDRSPLRQSIEKFHRNVEGISDAFGAAERLSGFERPGGSDDSSMSLMEMIRRSRSMSGFGDFDSMLKTIEADGTMSEEDVRRTQQKIDSVFTQDDFEFRIDRETSNREGKLFGRSNAGLMSLSDYQRVRGIEGDMSFGGGIGREDRDGKGGRLRGLTKKFKSLKRGVDGMGGTIRGMIPNMQLWWSLIGAIIPVLGAMAVQALGVAAAMGSMAVAGAGIVGLGLIGHGDSMAESFRNAGEQVDELKKGLFEAFEPTADLFSQTQAEFFDFIPGEMERVAQSMEGLLAYDDSLFSMFRGLTQWVSSFFDVITGNAAVIQQLSDRFGEILGSTLLDLFKGLLKEGYENQQMLIRLGETFKVLAIALYNVFVFVSQLLIVLKPLFKVFAFFSNLLQNSLIGGLAAFVTILALSTYAAVSLTGSIIALQTALASGTIPLISTMISSMGAYVPTALSAAMANYALAESIATVIGVATLGAGIAIAGWAGVKAYQGMKQAQKINNDFNNGGMEAGSLPGGSSVGSQTFINEGDTVTYNMGDSETSTLEALRDSGSGGGGSRGPTDGAYTPS